MHLSLVIAVAPLALASTQHKLLHARQESNAFKPSTGGIVSNCQNPCGEFICLRPERGDTCCAEGYGCPGGNFCLTQGYCCPDGDDPATCARQNGVTLPPNFVAGQTVAAGGLASTFAAPIPTTVPSTSVASPVTTSALLPPPDSSIPVVYSTASSAPAYPLPSNATLPSAPGAGAIPFTGAAERVSGGVLAALGGVAALLL